jgi:hypothetical protein
MPTKKKNGSPAVPADFQLKRTRTGLGLFANRPFRRGEFVIEYTGERITTQEADRRGGKYLFDVSTRVVVDGKDRKNLARYINHACRPNCAPEIKRGRIHILARRVIRRGEEITYNYGKEYFGDLIKPVGCRCAFCMTKRNAVTGTGKE